MPIKPENRALYPKDWKTAIVPEIAERAGGRCECEGECGLHHDRRCIEMNGQPAKFARGKVVLTAAHLDHDPTNNGEPGNRPNLKHMCQRCHLCYDAPRKTRERKEARRGKLNVVEMFPKGQDDG